MPYDRSTTMAARRGGHRPEDASLLQAAYASDIRADMAREGLSMNALAGKIGIKPGTLKGYLDGNSAWPIGIIQTMARLLGRSSEADLVALGYSSSPLAQRFLRQQQQLSLIDRLRRTALLADREPLADSPGAQLAAAALTSPEALKSGIDLRLRPLSRGRRHPMPFAELLIADFPGTDLDQLQARQRLLGLPVRPWRGQPKPAFSDAVDYSGAMVEEGEDLLSRWRAEYRTSRSAVMIIVPVLLATRPLDLDHLSPEAGHLDAVVVTSLNWGGSADVAALVAREFGWAYTSIGRLVRENFGGSYTPYGGLFEQPLSLAGRSFQLNCQLLGELLLDPGLTGKRRVSALDEPETAVQVIRQLRADPDQDHTRTPLIMLRMSSRRIEWTAGRRAMARPGGGAPHDEQAIADYEHLLVLQDDLTRAVEAVPDRPHLILDITEPEIEDYEDTSTDSTDPDFDAFVTTSKNVKTWLTSLADS
jgi:lambda repressor-like predicted transcriptional regulator